MKSDIGTWIFFHTALAILHRFSHSFCCYSIINIFQFPWVFVFVFPFKMSKHELETGKTGYICYYFIILLNQGQRTRFIYQSLIFIETFVPDYINVPHLFKKNVYYLHTAMVLYMCSRSSIHFFLVATLKIRIWWKA